MSYYFIGVNAPNKLFDDMTIIINGVRCRINKCIASQISPVLKSKFDSNSNNEVSIDLNQVNLEENEPKEEQHSLKTAVDELAVNKIFCGDYIEVSINNYAFLDSLAETLKIDQLAKIVNDFKIHFHINFLADVEEKIFCVNESNLGETARYLIEHLEKYDMYTIANLFVNFIHTRPKHIKILHDLFQKINPHLFMKYNSNLLNLIKESATRRNKNVINFIKLIESVKNEENNSLDISNSFDLIKVIENDDVETIQNYINIQKFDLNQTIGNKNQKLIDVSCYYGSIKIFKYLFLNLNKTITSSSVGFNAIKGGNIEIIRIIDQQYPFLNVGTEKCFKISIKYHHWDITRWLYETKLNGKLGDLFLTSHNDCICSSNFITFKEFILDGTFITDYKNINISSFKNVNTYLLACRNNEYRLVNWSIDFYKNEIIFGIKYSWYSENMKTLSEIFINNNYELASYLIKNTLININYDFPLKIAVRNDNKDMINLLLNQPKICLDFHEKGRYFVYIN